MNFYAFHIGDYASDTRHLSMLEDGAYRRLIDLYYTRECPLPSDLPEVFRLAGARSPAERKTVETVLREFFVKDEIGWRHKRCDLEIAVMRDKKLKAAQSANKRWRNANAMRTHSEGMEDKPVDNHANASEPHCEGNAPNTKTNTNTKILALPSHEEEVSVQGLSRGDFRVDPRTGEILAAVA